MTCLIMNSVVPWVIGGYFYTSFWQRIIFGFYLYQYDMQKFIFFSLYIFTVDQWMIFYSTTEIKAAR